MFDNQQCHAGKVEKKRNRKENGDYDLERTWWSIQKKKQESINWLLFNLRPA